MRTSRNGEGDEQLEIKRQLSMLDVSDEYKAFVEKFTPKKTTDDCYTPQAIYDAIAGWVAVEYGVDPERFVRPFWPGGDYERYSYTCDSIVVDNPPFSIISKIVTFYELNGIKYFLFCPYLTCFNTQPGCKILTGTSITYENGARVDTAFVTNLDDALVRTAPELGKRIKEMDAKLRVEKTKALPKYEYPADVLTASAMGYMAKYGVDFRVEREDALFVRGLDMQKKHGKQIYGGLYSQQACRR